MRRFLFLVLLAGCQPQPVPPAVVRATELASSYRDDPALTSRVYDGRVVLLGLSNPVRRGSEFHWHLASPDRPAVVVCRFDGEPPAVSSRIWITGTCHGKVYDGKAREFQGYDFYVLIVSCRPAGPPTTTTR